MTFQKFGITVQKIGLSLVVVGLILLISTLLFGEAKASCIDDSQKGEAKKTLSWTPASERENGELFPDDQNAGYSVHYTDTTDGTKCERRIPDKAARSANFNIYYNKQYDFTIRQWDTDGRISQHSEVLAVKIDKEVVPLGKAATVNDLTFTQVGDTKQYQFTFTDVTTFANGDPLPVAPRKYYLFSVDANGNDIVLDGRSSSWLGDIQYSELPKTFTMTNDVHYFNIETELSFDGQLTVSDRSATVTVDTIPPPPIVTPPLPPVIITIPEGAKTITFNL